MIPVSTKCGPRGRWRFSKAVTRTTDGAPIIEAAWTPTTSFSSYENGSGQLLTPIRAMRFEPELPPRRPLLEALRWAIHLLVGAPTPPRSVRPPARWRGSDRSGLRILADFRERFRSRTATIHQIVISFGDFAQVAGSITNCFDAHERDDKTLDRHIIGKLLCIRWQNLTFNHSVLSKIVFKDFDKSYP